MKIEPRQATAFLRSPGKCRAVLLYGEDEGLVRERGAGLTRLIAGSLSDPFQVVELERDGWSRLADEMAAISMMGGRRAIRVRDATDAILESVKSALRGPGDALLVLEAPGLGRGKLRSFMEAGADTASVACYAEEGRALLETIRLMLGEHGVSADAEAMSWLGETLGSDRAVLRAELDKLVLLVGAGGRIDIDTARLSAGDAASASADTGLLAATQGDVATADAEIERALAEGLNEIALIRMVLSHLQKLHQARLRVAAGVSVADALRAQRPPIFFKAIAAYTASVGLWSVDAITRAIEEARLVEIACKQTGARQELLVRRYVAALARQAQARGGRRP